MHKQYGKRIEKYLHQFCNDVYITTGILESIANNQTIDSYLDVGCGPGHKSMPFAKLAKKVTLIELLPEYEPSLHNIFPNAKIIIDSINNVNLEQEYDVILFSQNLYYHPVDQWVGLCKKLYSALRKKGKLIIIMNGDGSDWGRLITQFKSELGKQMCFYYEPMREFIQKIKDFAKVDVMTYQVQNFYPNYAVAIESIGKQILDIHSNDCYEKTIPKIKKFIDSLATINNQIIFNHDINLISVSHTG